MKITRVLFEKQYNGVRASIPISDIPVEFLASENNIMIHVEEPFYTENNSHDGYTSLRITRYDEQTEEEKSAFKRHLDELKAQRKEERRKQYLKLKEEFEPPKDSL